MRSVIFASAISVCASDSLLDENLSLLQVRAQKHHDAAPGAEECQQGIGYHSGPMIDGNAPASNAEQCNNQCSARAGCEFWDWSGDHCRLRSEAGGSGAQADSSSVGGALGCTFPQCNVNIGFHTGHMVDGNAPGNTPEACRDQCSQNSECLFWDLVGGTCRLRNEIGSGGAVEDDGAVAGERGCTLPAVPVTTTTTPAPTTAVPVVVPPVEVKAPVDEASAVGDPHMTAINGEKFDLCCSGGVCGRCPQ